MSASRVTDQATGDGEISGAHRAGHDEVILGGDIAEHGGPADEVVGQSGTDQPGGIGAEVARRDVLHARPLLQILDGQLHGGVGAVEGVDLCGGASLIGQESEVAPLGPECCLASDQPGPSHDESAPLVDALGHLGHAVRRVVDGRPGLFVDGRDGCDHGLHHAHPHRVADTEPSQCGDGVIRPEPRVEAHDQLTGGSGPTEPGHQFFDEALGSPLGVGRPFAHPDVDEFTGPGSGGDQWVVAELLGVAVTGAVLGLPAHRTDGGVEIDDQPIGPRACTQGPRPPQCLGEDSVQLPDMAITPMSV